jgi:hypothetical protein
MSATLALLIPWSAIAPVADQFGGREDATARRRGRRSSVRRAVGDVEMTVRAEVAACELPIEAVLALKEGDLLRLNAPAPAASRCTPTRCPCTPAARAAAAAAAPCRSPAARRAAMSADDALQRLGQSTAEACLGVLEMFAPGKVTSATSPSTPDSKPRSTACRCPPWRCRLLRRRRDRRQRLPDHAGRRAQARRRDDGHGRAGGPEAPELSELELSAVSEAMNQMMARRGRDVRRARHRGRDRHAGDQTFTAAERSPTPTRHPARRARALSICGEPARLVQLVPNAFVVRMSSALDDLGAEVAPPPPAPSEGLAVAPPNSPAKPSLAGIPVRVWAEFGPRAHALRAGRWPAGGRGRRAGSPGRRPDRPVRQWHIVATGRLVVVDETDWAVRIEHVLDKTKSSAESGMEVARWPESW